jgi:hypothetical protein
VTPLDEEVIEADACAGRGAGHPAIVPRPDHRRLAPMLAADGGYSG